MEVSNTARYATHFVESQRRLARKLPLRRWPLGMWVNVAKAMPFLVAVLSARMLGFRIFVYPTYFGHQTYEVEHLLRTNLGGKRILVLQCGPIPNGFLFEKHREVFCMLRLPRSWRRYVVSADAVYSRMTGRLLFYAHGHNAMIADTVTWNGISPKFKFTEDENRRGEEVLRRLGLERGRYVALHARDEAYALSFYVRSGVYRGAAVAAREEAGSTQRSRNMDFADYEDALRTLAGNALVGVRLGAKVGADCSHLPNLVEYAARLRETLGADGELADMYLMAHCAFYVGTSSGTTVSAFVFNRPMVWVNSFPWPWGNLPPFDGSLFLPKLIRRADGTIMRFPEMVEFSKTHDWRVFYDGDYLDRNGLTTVDNTPQEVEEAVREMCARLDGSWKPEPDDEIRQAQLRALFVPPVLPLGPARMGRDFLRRHAHLLVQTDA